MKILNFIGLGSITTSIILSIARFLAKFDFSPYLDILTGLFLILSIIYLIVKIKGKIVETNLKKKEHKIINGIKKNKQN